MEEERSRNMEMFMETGLADPSRQEAKQTSAGSYTRSIQRVATGGEEIHGKVSQGRAECTVPPLSGAKDSDRMSGEAELRSPPSVPRLQRTRDSVVLAFVMVNKAFEIKTLGGGFANSTEVMNARSRVDEAFNNLCVAQGEYAAVTGSTWADIAKYKPGYMTDLAAHKKKQDAVFLARAALEISEARAAETRALLWTLQMTREAEEATK